MADRGAKPIEWLRDFALSLERLAAEGVASGAVRGATGELRAGLPENLDVQVRMLLSRALVVLERLATEAAGSQASPLDTWSRSTAEGAVRGAVEEFRRLVPEMRPTTQQLLERLKLWLERSASESAERAEVVRAPGDRARIAAAGAVAGATEQLSVTLPLLAGGVAELASQLGRGLVRGAAEEVGRQLQRAGRNPFVLAVAGGGAIVAVFLAVRRR
jgi:hypothetical protein